MKRCKKEIVKNKHLKCISTNLENAIVQNWEHLVISSTQCIFLSKNCKHIQFGKKHDYTAACLRAYSQKLSKGC
jgi:hypothetical protein